MRFVLLLLLSGCVGGDAAAPTPPLAEAPTCPVTEVAPVEAEPPQPATVPPADPPTPLAPPPTGPFTVEALPDDGDGGCSCAFHRVGARDPVLTFPWGDPHAKMRLDGAVVELVIPGGAKDAEIRDRMDLAFRAGPIRARVRLKETHDGWDEVESVDYAGTVELTATGRPTKRLKIEGSCGC